MFLWEVKRANKNGTQVSYLQVITYTGSAGTFQQRTEFTAVQCGIYTTLELGPAQEDHRSGGPERLTSHNTDA